MPNWVCNNVVFHGNEKDINALKKFVQTDESGFDFRKIIPMPEELNLTSGSDETTAIECAKARRAGETTCERIKNCTRMSFDEWADLGEKYLRNLEKYGATSWYDWCCDKWGTKWNACDASWGDNEVSFNTAWSTPEPIFEALAQRYPGVVFDVSFADEDLGNNCGTISYDGESVDVNYIDDFEFACDVWGYDPDEMRD